MDKLTVAVTRIAIVFLAFLLITRSAAAQPAVKVNLNTTTPATAIPSDFLGLSFETLTLLPHPDGTLTYFVPSNRRLIQLFHTLAAHGDLLPFKATDAPTTLKIYATRGSAKTIYLTLINKQIDANQPPATIEASLPPHFKKISTMSLTAPSLNAISGVQLGGASIDGEGNWSGTWQATQSHDKTLRLEVPPSSALLIKIEP
jgi:hypothetical protein